MKLVEQILGMQPGQLNSLIFEVLSNLILAILIVILGFWLTSVIVRLLIKMLRKSETDAGLVSFLGSFLSMALKILIVISAITQLGIPMTSFLTLIGAAGIAIGMAISGTLSNFAGGIMILVLKPFKVGDMIQAQGEEGVVNEIQIFNTFLKTADNKVIIFPNGPLANGNITNYTRENTRRVEWNIEIVHPKPFPELQDHLTKILTENPRVKTKLPLIVGINQISENSITIKMQAWVKTADLTQVYFEVNAAVYEALPILSLG